jgi:hypothetical protein
MPQFFLKNLNVQVKQTSLILNPDTTTVYDTFTVSGWPIGTAGNIYLEDSIYSNIKFNIKSYLTTDTSVVITYDDLKEHFTYTLDDNDNAFIYSEPAYIKTNTQSSLYPITYIKSLNLSSSNTTIYDSFTVSGWPIGTEGTIYLNLPYQEDPDTGSLTLNIPVKSYLTTDTSVVVTYDDLLQNGSSIYFDSYQECYVVTNYNQRLPYPILFRKSLNISPSDTTIYGSFTISGWPSGIEGTIFLELPYVDNYDRIIVLKSYSTTDTSVVITYDDLLQNDTNGNFDPNQLCNIISMSYTEPNYQYVPYPILFKP